MVSFTDRDVRQYKGALPYAESIQDYAFGVPSFKHCDTQAIDRYIAAFKKVFTQIDVLVEA
ncbi:MAG: hypothetical protein JEY71_07875 [Sphaerochaeta sp.]|nr:hypothetical protein [Sphaerochaeta sp.]